MLIPIRRQFNDVSVDMTPTMLVDVSLHRIRRRFFIFPKKKRFSIAEDHYRGLTGGFLLLRNFSVTISVSPHACFILV